MVLAGPGSGKTSVIVERTAYMINEGKIPASSILVVTFSRAAATEMKERFLKFVGQNRSEVTFGTFHGIFYGILKAAYHLSAANILSEEEKFSILREMTEKYGQEMAQEGDFIEEVAREISVVKGNCISPEHYYASCCSDEIFRDIFHGYKQALKAKRKLDFDDMILCCYELFSQRQDILNAWRRKFVYILVDEFQDINSLQYKILQMLAAPVNNLFIVGDDDQSIYKFRGADIGNILNFEKVFPDRLFDVGIAEEHAVSFAAGLALGGVIPVVAIYSSFLQRAVDQMLHDVCMQKLHVIFAIDRAGLVGADGETHQGIFDISYLSHIPNMVLMAPKNEKEMPAMMKFALEYNGPIAMKYPRGSVYDGLSEYNAPIELGKSEMIYEGQDVVILAVGNIMEECEKAVQLLKSQGYNPGLVNVRFIRPMDEEMLHVLSKKYSLIVTVEENQLIGGYGQMVSAFLHKNVCKNQLLTLGISDYFVGHATVNEQREEAGINADSIVKSIIDRMN